MPIILDEKPVVLGREAPPSLLTGQVAEFPSDPDTLDVFESAFRVENSVGSWLSNEQMPNLPAQIDYNPYDDDGKDIKGYEFFANSFVASQSPEQTAWIKQKIDREIEDRKVVDAGGALGVVAYIAAGMTDPMLLPAFLVPGGPLIGASSILGAGLRTAGAAGVLEAGVEGVKHSTQSARTGTESLINIGGAALVSGILGSSVAALTRKELDTFSEEMTEYLSSPRSVGAAQANRLEAEDTRTASSLTRLEKVGVSPLLRTTESPSQATREAANQLVESPLHTKGNIEGIVTTGATGSVETLVKRYDAQLGASFEEMDNLYMAYRKQRPGFAARAQLGVKDLFGSRGRAGQLTYREFREQVAQAMRRNDESPIPEVAQAARTFRAQLFDPLKKSAQELGLLPDDVSVSTAPTYLTRVWNVGRIKARRTELENILADWIVESGGEAAESLDAAREIVNNILGSPGGRIPVEIMPRKPVAKAGPLKERVLLIPDSRIEAFLDNDIERIAQYYKRSLAPEVELVRRFGDKDMRGVLQSIEDDYAQLRKALDEREFKTDKARERAALALDRKRDADIRDIEAMRDRLLGTYKAPDDPDSFFIRATETTKRLNYIAKLGGQTLSALPDVPRAVFLTGLRPVLGGLLSLARSPKAFKMARREVKAAGTAWDMVLNTRANSLAEITDMYGRQTAFERGLRALGNNFGLVSLMAPWNAAVKQFSGVVISSNMARVIMQMSSGKKLSAKTIQKLAVSGIDEAMAKRIATQLANHSEDSGGIVVSGAHKWDDLDAIDAWRSAVVKDVDRAIVTPGIGERPLWMSTPVGQLVGQFKSFAFSSAHKITLSGLQQRDLAALNGLLLMTSMGAITYGLKETVAGRPVSDDPRIWIVEAIDRSGVTGYLFDVNNIIEKLTRGSIGVSALTGGPQMSRYASRNVAGALLGPTFGAVRDLATTTGALSSGDISESDIRAMRKLLFYQNLFYFRRLFDRLEEKAASFFE